MRYNDDRELGKKQNDTGSITLLNGGKGKRVNIYYTKNYKKEMSEANGNKNNEWMPMVGINKHILFLFASCYTLNGGIHPAIGLASTTSFCEFLQI